MNIALVDIQPKNRKKVYPNLALMKLSAWHKAQGDEVDLVNPQNDKVYASKILTYVPTPNLPKGTIYGGSGFDLTTCLEGYKRGGSPEGIDRICPDYELYGMRYSMGFFTRGCPHRCPWCFVPEKEGDIHAYMVFDDFIRHDKAVLMDNNVLAHPHGITQIERLIKERVKVDFNQGLDARLIDAAMARLLAKVRWWPNVRLACDSEASMKQLEKAVNALRAASVRPVRYSVYTLVTANIEESHERIKFVESLNCTPFAQPYRDKAGTEPTAEAKDLASWCNKADLRKTITYKQYYDKRHKTLLRSL
jgi:hypothetical protein